jgi:quercetin dioxygenase-like cupin family protein
MTVSGSTDLFWSLLAAAGVITLLSALASRNWPAAQMRAPCTALPNVPGKTITAIVLKYAPGEKSPPHFHDGSVMAYVLSGAIRSENSAAGSARVYRSGEVIFEPFGSEHLVSENPAPVSPRVCSRCS